MHAPLLCPQVNINRDQSYTRAQSLMLSRTFDLLAIIVRAAPVKHAPHIICHPHKCPSRMEDQCKCSILVALFLFTRINFVRWIRRAPRTKIYKTWKQPAAGLNHDLRRPATCSQVCHAHARIYVRTWDQLCVTWENKNTFFGCAEQRTHKVN